MTSNVIAHICRYNLSIETIGAGRRVDQLRTFVAAADAGSFSAAGRSLGRAQSVVRCSTESAVFRSFPTRAALCWEKPALSSGGMDQFKAVAKGLAGGLEAELSVAVDVMFPIELLTCAVSEFQAKFPKTPLRLCRSARGSNPPGS